MAVLVCQQRGHRGRAATEIVLLANRGFEARFANAGDPDAVGFADRTVDVGIRGIGTGAEPRRQCERYRRQQVAQQLHLFELDVDNRCVLDQHVGAGILDRGRDACRVRECAFRNAVRAGQDIDCGVFRYGAMQAHVVDRDFGASADIV
ncbi:hypothetical protein D3C72_1739270 [compost metagenome]